MSLGHFTSPIGEGPEAQREALMQCLDMLRGQIERGGIDGLAIIYVGPVQADDTCTYGMRYMIGPQHLDFLDRAFKEMLRQLCETYGVTPEFIRAEREKGLKGG